MKTFQQFQEDAYKNPKNTAKVAKEYEKSGAKFPDEKTREDIKTYTDSTSDFIDPADTGFKKHLRNMLSGFTRRSTPIVGRDTKYVNPNTDRKVINFFKQDFKTDTKYDINKNKKLRVIKHPIMAPEIKKNTPKGFNFT